MAMFSGLKFPANALQVIEFMVKIATFDLVPTENIDNMIYYWPESEGAFSVNFEMTGVETKLLLANIGFVLYMIYLNVFAILIHAVIYKFRNSSQKVNKLYKKLSSYLYWTGLNRLFMELFFDITFLSILNLHTVDWST